MCLCRRDRAQATPKQIKGGSLHPAFSGVQIFSLFDSLNAEVPPCTNRHMQTHTHAHTRTRTCAVMFRPVTAGLSADWGGAYDVL